MYTLYILIYFSYICISLIQFIYIMKLFISNKSDMDYQLQSEAKEAHKLAYNELLRNLTVENSIPISLLVSKGRIDYLFSLDKVDVEKDLYIYNFRGSVLD